jgi:hypothetical protein
MRTSVAAATFALLAGAASADDTATPWRIVHLNSPGALAELQASNPEHYRMIMSHMGIVEGGPHGLIQVRSDRPDARREIMMLTTYPPQRNFEISLDNTTYKGRATLDIGYRPWTLEHQAPYAVRR